MLWGFFYLGKVMQDKDPTGLAVNWFAILIATLFGLTGGIVKHLSDSNESGRKATLQGTFIQGVIGGFSGSLVTMYSLEKGFAVWNKATTSQGKAISPGLVNRRNAEIELYPKLAYLIIWQRS